MDHDQDAEGAAQAKEEEAILPARVIGVREDPGIVVEEGSLCLVEADAVLPEVGRRLGAVPLEPDRVHGVMYVLCTYEASPTRDGLTPTFSCKAPHKMRVRGASFVRRLVSCNVR